MRSKNHFRTWDALLVALVAYIDSEIVSAFESGVGELGKVSVRDMIEFMLDEHVGTAYGLFNDRLWAQLWAMEQVESMISDLLKEVYAKFLAHLEAKLVRAGVANPRAEALALMSMAEGESLFTGSGRRWEKDRPAVRQSILHLVDERYGAV